jgi:membrane associated rhomboid family serine protease
MTFALIAAMLTVFLFTANEVVTPVSKTTENNTCNITCPRICKYYFDYKVCSEADYDSCSCVIPKFRLYQNMFGFIPTNPRIYSLITYAFIHVDIFHLFFNLVFLLIVGLAIEEVLDKWVFLAIFVSSANAAIVFDILGRFLTKISFSIPFIGASGGIFGLLAVASIIKKNERIPVILNILLLIALIANFQPMISWLLSTGSTFGKNMVLMVGALLFMVTCSILLLMPGLPSLPIVLLLFLVNAFVIVLSDYPTATSNLGHLGGVIGGLISLFVFSETKKH